MRCRLWQNYEAVTSLCSLIHMALPAYFLAAGFLGGTGIILFCARPAVLPFRHP